MRIVKYIVAFALVCLGLWGSVTLWSGRSIVGPISTTMPPVKIPGAARPPFTGPTGTRGEDTVIGSPAPPHDARGDPADHGAAGDLATFTGLTQGSAAVSAPRTVERDQTFEVVLRVSPAELDKLLRAMAQAGEPDAQVAGKDMVRLSRTMVARLEAPELIVRPEEPVRQSIDAVDGAQWSWLVRATKGGLHKLQVTLTGEVASATRTDVHRFYAYSHELTVTVGALGLLADHWQWVGSAVVIPLAVAMWTWWRKGKKGGGIRRPRS